MHALTMPEAHPTGSHIAVLVPIVLRSVRALKPGSRSLLKPTLVTKFDRFDLVGFDPRSVRGLNGSRSATGTNPGQTRIRTNTDYGFSTCAISKQMVRPAES